MVDKVYEHIFFIDIETVPQAERFELLSEKEQSLFSNKVRFQLQNQDSSVSELYAEKGGILSEFNRIICISVGVLSHDENDTLFLKCHSYSGDDEKKILTQFADLLNNNKKQYPSLCAHNGKEFDFPVLCRRLLINGIELPTQLNVIGKKPWETSFIDTLDMWKFGDYKHYTSLELLAHVFGIPSPKDDITGADVATVYYQENDLKRIVQYCEKDVVTLTKVYLKLAHNIQLEA